MALADVIADVQARDEADRTRAAAPLMMAVDAALIDTTDMDADAAFACALQKIREKTGQ